MYILLPVSSDNKDTTQLTKIEESKFWAQIFVEDGELQEIVFNLDKDGFENFSECVVVANDNEYVWPFMEQNIMVLVAHVQRSIEDIVEAYIFKELHELAY